MSAANNAPLRPATVTKPIPLTFDLGNLLCSDTNPLPPAPTTADISSAARDCAQALVNQLLTVCPIRSDPNEGTLLTLPQPSTALPREKPLPAEKAETKWELFARKKGIKSKKSGGGKLTYDEEKGDWVPKWGYKGRNKDGEGDWIVEVDTEKEERLEGAETIRSQGRKERMEKVRRNERRQRANERKARKKGLT